MTKPPAETPASSSPPSDGSFLGLRRNDQLFVGVCVILALLLLLVQSARLSGWGTPVIEIDRLPERQYDYQLDVNRATWTEWALLEGIGEKLGKRIVEDREAQGPFTKVEDVQRVKGIGPKIWERIRPRLKLSAEPPKDAVKSAE